MNIKRISIACLMMISGLMYGQEIINPVLTGAPFLRVSPDARAGGLGDMGAATSPDAFSQYWNASKYAFSKSYSGVSVSFTPYMICITYDVFFIYTIFY